MSAAVSLPPADMGTPEQEARATLLAALEVASAKARRLHDLAEDLADQALGLALLASEVAADAVRWDEAAIRYACEYGKRVDLATDEPCSCPSCTAEGRP